MRASPLVAPVLLALVGGCNRDYANPFADARTSLPPSASAALMVTSGVWSTKAGAGREVYALNADGAGLTRLTNCNQGDTPCDAIEVSPAPDRNRIYARRATGSATAPPALTFLDLSRSAETQVIPPSQQPSGVDWSPADGVVVYSGAGAGGADDLFVMDVNGANNRNLTSTPAVRERKPRVDPTGSVAVYERIEGAATGLARIFIFVTAQSQVQVTSGGLGGPDVLAGTPYVVGSDSEPDYSPDGSRIVFRRLTATGNGGLGTWDLYTVAINGSGLKVIATGPVFRGAPDWGPKGIVFTETDAAAGTARLVLIPPDGTGRQVLLSQGAAFNLGSARWLR